MPQPPHTHRNHPPITPHPKTVFLSDLSVCITDSSGGHQSRCTTASMSFLPSQKSLRFLSSPPPPPSNATPPHTPSQTSTSFPHSPEHITVTTPHVHDHSYATLPHTQTDAITKVNNWMKDGSVCSDSSSSSEAETAASAPTPATYAEAAAASAASTRYCLTNPFSHPFEHIHASSIFMPSLNHPHRQHHYKTHTRGN